MAASMADDQVLTRFRAAVAEAYGDRVERIMLFGSRARGDARSDSDYDVAVFLRGMENHWQEISRLANIGTEILYDQGRFVHAMPYRAGTYADRTPLMHEIRKDGVDL